MGYKNDAKRLWHEGSIRVNGDLFHYWVKQYDEKSQYSIDGGRISKLKLMRDGKITCEYDRGWAVEPEDWNTEMAYETLIREYNQ